MGDNFRRRSGVQVRFPLLIGVLLAGLEVSAATLYCRSSDFNPALKIGQGLEVELNDESDIVRVYKMPGSEFCADVSYEAPEVGRMTAKTIVYDLNFPDCKTWNEHLAVPMKKRPTWMRFEFTWSDGLSFRRERIFLTCKKS